MHSNEYNSTTNEFLTHLSNSLTSLNAVYSTLKKQKTGNTEETISAPLNFLFDQCFKKFDTWKKGGPLQSLFRTQNKKTVASYIEYLNKDTASHEHARMLFQILFTALENSNLHNMIAAIYIDERKKLFIEECKSCFDKKMVVNAVFPLVAADEYKKFMDTLTALKTIEIIAEINSSKYITDNLAEKFYKATSGAGNSPGAKLAEHFLKNIIPHMENTKLFELTRGVMRAQQKDQIVSATEPFLRRTGVITDKLYLEYTQRFHYDPKNSPANATQEIVALNKEILLGKGYQDTDDVNSPAVKNAVIEINFKLKKLTDPNGITDILEQVRKRVTPPPLPVRQPPSVPTRRK